MKLVPNAIARKVAGSQLMASEHSPTILFGAGVVGMVGSTVLACRATLRLESVLDEIEHTKSKAHAAKSQVERGVVDESVTYPDREYRRDLALISIQGVGKVAKLYAPAVILGGVSIACLSKSHNILQDRNTALVAAYTAMDTAFKNYRERVVEKYGEEEDRNFLYESEVVDIVDSDGEVDTITRAIGAPGSAYARWYDQYSSRNWSVDPDINLLCLRNVQNRMCDRLQIKGHVFLNEVYDALGMEHTKAGAIVGWRYNVDTGDGFVDFGIWDGGDPAVIDFFNGREGAILLDFNVDGVIFNQLGGEDR